jgi:hypothetical protein
MDSGAEQEQAAHGYHLSSLILTSLADHTSIDADAGRAVIRFRLAVPDRFT